MIILKKILLRSIRFYQKYLSIDTGLAKRFVRTGGVCRFTPTCSEYTYQAIDTYGIIRGVYIGLRRILRCHPWSTGGFDPIP